MNINALATSIRNQKFDGSILVAEALENLNSRLGLLQVAVEDQGAEVEAIDVGSIGNVYIQSVIPTYEPQTDNENVLVKLSITYKPPTPLFNFDRVKVYLEIPDGSEQIRLVEEFPYDSGGSPATVAVFYEPPTSSEQWRVYVVSGDTQGDFNPFRLFTQASPSPSYQVTVAPKPEGGSGTEWTSNITGLTAAVEYGVNEAGIQLYRIYGTFSDPADITFRGVRFVADDGTDQWQLTYVPKDNGAYVSPWSAVPETSTPITVYGQSQGPHYRLNSIVPGTTPSANVTVERQTGLGGLKLTLVDTGTFNTDEFEIDPGEGFRVKVLNADKIQTGILKVGGGSNKPGQLGVFSATDTLIGWIGEQDDGGGGYWYGGWMKQLWVGGNNPSDAPLYTNASGELAIESISSGGRIFMNPTYGYISVQDTGETGDPATNKTSVISAQSVSTIYGQFGGGGYRGAFMQSDAGYGEIFVTDAIGNTRLYMKADVGQFMFQNVSSATAPPATYAAMRASAGDAYWYDPDSASWRRLAYADEISAGASPGGSNSHVQYNDSGSFGGESAFLYNKTTNQLTVSGRISSGSIINASGGYEVGGSTVINSVKQGLFYSLNVTYGITFGNSSLQQGTWELVDASHNATFNSLTIGATERINSSGKFYPYWYSQDAQPTPAATEVSMWQDTDDSRIYLITKIGSTVYKVELT